MRGKEKLPELTINICNKTYTTNYNKEVEISRETLDENMFEQASLYTWYAVLMELLDEEVGIKKLELGIEESELYNEYKKKFLKENEKITDKAIDAEVRQDKRYIEATVALLEMKKNHGVFKAITKGFEHRREMLINTGAKVRKEMDGETMTKTIGKKD